MSILAVPHSKQQIDRKTDEIKENWKRLPQWKRDLLEKKQQQRNSLIFLKEKKDEHCVHTTSSWTGSSDRNDLQGSKPQYRSSSSVTGRATSPPNNISRERSWSPHRSVASQRCISPRRSISPLRDSSPCRLKETTDEDDDDEVTYGRGFVHRLLQKFSHLSNQSSEHEVTSPRGRTEGSTSPRTPPVESFVTSPRTPSLADASHTSMVDVGLSSVNGQQVASNHDPVTQNHFSYDKCGSETDPSVEEEHVSSVAVARSLFENIIATTVAIKPSVSHEPAHKPSVHSLIAVDLLNGLSSREEEIGDDAGSSEDVSSHSRALNSFSSVRVSTRTNINASVNPAIATKPTDFKHEIQRAKPALPPSPKPTLPLSPKPTLPPSPKTMLPPSPKTTLPPSPKTTLPPSPKPRLLPSPVKTAPGNNSSWIKPKLDISSDSRDRASDSRDRASAEKSSSRGNSVAFVQSHEMERRGKHTSNQHEISSTEQSAQGPGLNNTLSYTKQEESKILKPRETANSDVLIPTDSAVPKYDKRVKIANASYNNPVVINGSRENSEVPVKKAVEEIKKLPVQVSMGKIQTHDVADGAKDKSTSRSPGQDRLEQKITLNNNSQDKSAPTTNTLKDITTSAPLKASPSLPMRSRRKVFTKSTSAPGDLIIRPASNIALGATSITPKYNDIRTGSFAPATRRPSYYSDSDEDDQVDNLQECIIFINAEVKLDRSLLIKSHKGIKLTLTFTDSSPSVYEYPSEQFLMDSLPPQPGDLDYINHDDKTSDEQLQPLGLLSSYQSKLVPEYELGSRLDAVAAATSTVSDRTTSRSPPRSPDPDNPWSQSASSDLLF